MAYHNNPRIVTDGLALCIDANAKRSYSSSNVHSDNWSGNPCDAKIAMYIDGDKKNTIEFYQLKCYDLLHFPFEFCKLNQRLNL